MSPLAGTCTGNVVRQIKINKNKSFVCPLYYATIILIKLYSVHFQSSAFLLFSAATLQQSVTEIAQRKDFTRMDIERKTFT